MVMDENAMATGVAIHVALASRFLGRGGTFD
jgi:hypothetical protein